MRQTLSTLPSLRFFGTSVLGLFLALAGWQILSGCTTAPPFDWQLPPGVTPPKAPETNPMNAAKVALGRRLFYDPQMSYNGTISCSSCHQQALAFTDGRAASVGAAGEPTPRSAMSLANVGYRETLTWANPLLHSLELQLRVPMFGEAPMELGLAGRDAELLARLGGAPVYRQGFARAFPDRPEPLSLSSIVQALAAFCRTLVSRNAPYDRYQRGDTSALSDDAGAGMKLFFSPRLSCFRCHGGVDFNAPRDPEDRPSTGPRFHNTGLYNLAFSEGPDGQGGYPVGGRGLYAVSLKPEDMGKFRAPTLRNIAQTAPYMHDGSITSLEGVIDHYAAGGRHIATGTRAGDGRTNPYKSELLKGFALAPDERRALLAFLHALTDQDFLQNPAHSNPWTEPRQGN